MNTYAFQKFHLASEILRSSNDHRKNLSDAFSQELNQLSEEDYPEAFSARISALLDTLRLSENVIPLNGNSRVSVCLENLSDSEISSCIEEIFSIEKLLKKP